MQKEQNGTPAACSQPAAPNKRAAAAVSLAVTSLHSSPPVPLAPEHERKQGRQRTDRESGVSATGLAPSRGVLLPKSAAAFLPSFLRRQIVLESCGIVDQKEEWGKKRFLVTLHKCKQVVVISAMQGPANCKNTH